MRRFRHVSTSSRRRRRLGPRPRVPWGHRARQVRRRPSSAPSFEGETTCSRATGRTSGVGRRDTRPPAPTNGCVGSARSRASAAVSVRTRRSCPSATRRSSIISRGATWSASIRCRPTIPAGSWRPTSTRSRGPRTSRPSSGHAGGGGFNQRWSGRGRATARTCGSSLRARCRQRWLGAWGASSSPRRCESGTRSRWIPTTGSSRTRTRCRAGASVI